jgi:GNAT superfamily N-acetyltransferase
MEIKVYLGTIETIEEITLLFDAYRVFYKQSSDPSNAKAFLSARIKNDESVILISYCEKVPCGFTQLYPVFSSVSMQPTYILNDLFVLPEYRNKGIGKILLDAAKEHTINNGFKGLALETYHNNPARRLYEKEGWEEDKEFVHYFWKNPN